MPIRKTRILFFFSLHEKKSAVEESYLSENTSYYHPLFKKTQPILSAQFSIRNISPNQTERTSSASQKPILRFSQLF